MAKHAKRDVNKDLEYRVLTFVKKINTIHSKDIELTIPLRDKLLCTYKRLLKELNFFMPERRAEAVVTECPLRYQHSVMLRDIIITLDTINSPILNKIPNGIKQ